MGYFLGNLLIGAIKEIREKSIKKAIVLFVKVYLPFYFKKKSVRYLNLIFLKVRQKDLIFVLTFI